jgi:hypothetical protein
VGCKFLCLLLHITVLSKLKILILLSVCIFGILRVVELVNYQADNLTGMLYTALKYMDTNCYDSKRSIRSYMGSSRDKSGYNMCLRCADAAYFTFLQGIL